LCLGRSRVAAAGDSNPGTGQRDEGLVKQTQNPVADLISVPLGTTLRHRSKNRTVYVGNIQPVIPIHYVAGIHHAHHMPIINQPSLFPGMGSATGLVTSTRRFFSPAKSGELIWGAGPTFTLPTATDS
jgi:hypothetical protein